MLNPYEHATCSWLNSQFFPEVDENPYGPAQVSNAIEAQAGTLLEFVGDEAGPGIVDGLLGLLMVLWMFCGCLVIQVTDII